MNFKESKPIYLQIAERLMDQIMQGTYEEGGRIPSVREYAAEVEVNANTVVRTYDYLQGRNIVFNRRGIGYFVGEGARQSIFRLRRAVFVEEELPDLFRKMQLLGITIEELDEEYRKFVS